jgi:superoxide reductase
LPKGRKEKMTKLNQIYKCNICGNIVTVLHPGAGELVCCGQPMELLVEKTKDEGLEKHVPVIEKTKTGLKIKIGSIPHPMIKEHFIEWVEIIANGKVYRQFLKPKDKPEAEFNISAKKIIAREYCNIHGLWKK